MVFVLEDLDQLDGVFEQEVGNFGLQVLRENSEQLVDVVLGTLVNDVGLTGLVEVRHDVVQLLWHGELAQEGLQDLVTRLRLVI